MLAGTTLKREVKANPKDRIEVEIGDAKQPDFKPQFKIKRWDNEVNFSMRAEEVTDATVDIEAGIVKYKAKDYEVHQYEKPEAGEDGGFEFEWVLNKKPESNVLRTTIQHKGLDFLYQPELTAEQIKQGASRDENVIGSYAVYHSTKKSNSVGGNEYKNGKAFHIYRPHAVDADGVKVWCDLNITEGELTVTVPEDFLNKASYPVVVDPTLGYTSLGSSGQILGYSSTSNLYGFEGDISGGETDFVSFGLKKDTGFGRDAIAYIYSNAATQLDSETKNLASNSFAFIDFTLLGNNVLTGNNYFVTKPSGPNVELAYDTSSATAGGYIVVDYFDNANNAWISESARNYSVYATYTEATSGTEVNDQRSASITGQESDNAVSDAVIAGSSSAAASRSAKIDGIMAQAADAQRAASVDGAYATDTWQIQRNDNGGGWNDIEAAIVINEVGGVFIHDDDSTLTAGVEYCYRVRNLADDSNWSNVSCVTFTAGEGAAANRAAAVSGTASATNDRQAKVIGVNTNNAERGATAFGLDTDSNERSSLVTGVQGENATRSASMTGLDTDQIEIAAKTTGAADDNAERGAVVVGQEAAQNERSASIQGKASETAERDAKTTGSAVLTASRPAATRGQAAADTSRSAKVTGSAQAAVEKLAKVIGELVDTAERNAKVSGTASEGSNRSATTIGDGGEAAIREANTHGRESTNNNRSAKTIGAAAAAASRAVKAAGVASETADRSATIQGSETEQVERDAKVTGEVTATQTIEAIVHGVAIDNENRNAEIKGAINVTASRGASVTGGGRGNPYCPEDTPYTDKADKFMSKDSPFANKISPYNKKTAVYIPFDKRNC